MRNYKFVSLKSMFLSATLLWLLPALAAAQAVTTQITATEVFDPYNLFGNGVVGTLTAGTLNCPGGQPTGNPMQPCSPGSRIHMRGIEWKTRIISQSFLFTGWLYGTANSNWDANGTGEVWGDWRIELDAGGVWEGSFTADRSKAESVWVLHAKAVGHGSGGSVDGMQVHFMEAATQFPLLSLGWFGSIEAEILAPPSR